MEREQKQEEMFPDMPKKDKGITILEKAIRQIDARKEMKPKKSKLAEIAEELRSLDKKI